jgi:hypothetical protein
MASITELDSSDLISSLMSDLCPMCGKFKQPRHTMCGGCYRKLPGHLKRDLYKYVGEGYEEAVSESMNSLGVTDFIMPKNRT